MKIRIFKKYYTDLGNYQGIEIFMFITKFFNIRWFTDCGEWFLYITVCRTWFRFSSCGFMKGK